MATVSPEEENFVRHSMLLTGVAPRAIRVLFDRELPPPLSRFVRNHSAKFDSLKYNRIINKSQWTILNGKSNFIFPLQAM